MNPDQKTMDDALVTIEMLKVFISLSQTLSISEAARNLGLSRPTASRRLADMETLVDGPLFNLVGQNYKLTEAGYQRLPSAIQIVDDSVDWRSNQHNSRMKYSGAVQRGTGTYFWAQKYPLTALYKYGTPLMKAFLTSWVAAESNIEDPSMAGIKDFLIIFRDTSSGLICSHMGDQASYGVWFGKDVAKNVVGLPAKRDFAYDNYNLFSDNAYRGVLREGGFRIDHIHGEFPRPNFTEPQPLSLQRMMAAITFPDKTRGLAILIVMTNRVTIDDMPNECHNRLPKHLEMGTIFI